MNLYKNEYSEDEIMTYSKDQITVQLHKVYIKYDQSIHQSGLLIFLKTVFVFHIVKMFHVKWTLHEDFTK